MLKNLLTLLLLTLLTSCIPGITTPAIKEATPKEGIVNISAGQLELKPAFTTDVISWLLASDKPFGLDGVEATQTLDMLRNPEGMQRNPLGSPDVSFYEAESQDKLTVYYGSDDADFALLSFSVQFRETGETTEYYIDYPSCLKKLTCKLVN